MILTKVLEKKSVIQFFGLAIFLSPAINTLFKMIMLSQNSSRSFFHINIWTLISASPLSFKLLYIANIVIGLLILGGSKNAWKYTLVLLFCYIFTQLINLNSDYKKNKFSIVYPIVNSLVFAFIADQLVYKIKLKIPVIKTKQVELSQNKQDLVTRNSSPVTKSSRKKILLNLDGLGHWAQVMSVSNKGIQVRAIMPPPAGVFSREVRFTLKNGPILKARLTEHKGNEFFFTYSDLGFKEIALLKSWLGQSNTIRAA